MSSLKGTLAPKVPKGTTRLTSEVMSYFSDIESPLAPSQIDVVMGIPRGLAHDLIVRHWYEQKVAAGA